MATKLFGSNNLSIFESSDGAVYAAEHGYVTSDERNSLVESVRESLLAISPDAMRLAKAYAAIDRYESTEVRCASESIRHETQL